MTNPFEDAVKTADKAALEENKRMRDAEIAKRKHWVTINVRSCDTTRDCYCLNTNGFDHHEWESPWVVDMLGNYERNQGKEQPLAFPFRQDEDLEDYRIRMARREAWTEGYVKAWWVQTGNSNGTPGPTANPYE